MIAPVNGSEHYMSEVIIDACFCMCIPFSIVFHDISNIASGSFEEDFFASVICSNYFQFPILFHSGLKHTFAAKSSFIDYKRGDVYLCTCL